MTNTVPGGRYITADGVLRDANGNPIEDESNTPIITQPVEQDMMPILPVVEPPTMPPDNPVKSEPAPRKRTKKDTRAGSD